MCKITVIRYTCRHDIHHTESACRGQKKQGLGSSEQACLKNPYHSLHTYIPHKCGSCSRADAEQVIRHDLELPFGPVTAVQQMTLEELFAEMYRRIPTSNWRPLASPVYSRRPSQKRSGSPRKHSLLRVEVNADEACGPEAWESNIVPATKDDAPVYETVCDGWGWEWTSETKSLTAEVAEDKKKHPCEIQDPQDGDEEDECAEEMGDEESEMVEGGDSALVTEQTPLPLDSELTNDCEVSCPASEATTTPATCDPASSNQAQPDFVTNTTTESHDDAPLQASTYHTPVPKGFGLEDTSTAKDSHTSPPSSPTISHSTAPSQASAYLLPSPESYSLGAPSTAENTSTPVTPSPTLLTSPHGSSPSPMSKSFSSYWYRPNKNSTSGGNGSARFWELVIVQVN